MQDQIVFRDVWQKNDARAEADAIAAWDAAGDKLGRITSLERAKALCIVAYEDDRIVGTVTGEVLYMPMVRENMAFLQAFVVPQHRSQSLIIDLALAFHTAMTRYALEQPQLRIGGSAAQIPATGAIDKPVGRGGLVLVGYNQLNWPVKVRWFDHFRIDEEAARARDPKLMKAPAQNQ
ncbi:MAG TPA: hypothetical protein VIM56_02105 [Rhizomicrobium sp.]